MTLDEVPEQEGIVYTELRATRHRPRVPLPTLMETCTMHRPFLLAGFGLAAALIASACNTEPVDDLSAETELELYQPGDPIVVTITNESDEDVPYRACPSIWERQTDDGHDRVEGLEVCTGEVTEVEANSSVDVTYHFPVGQPLGTWRIVIPVGTGNPANEIRTNDFLMVVTEN